jgi:hypothetical protein
MADITIQSNRPASAGAVVRAIDAVLDCVEGFIRSLGERPIDLRRSLHEAQIHHAAASGPRGQATL